MLKKSILGIAIIYTLLLAVFSLIDGSGGPTWDIPHIDKWFHFFAYFGLCFCWFYVFSQTFNRVFKKSIIISFVISILFGIIIEVLQDTLTKTREADYLDVLANFLGAAFNVSLLVYFKKFGIKK